LQLQIVGFRLQQLLKLLLEALAAPWKWPWHDIKSIQKKNIQKKLWDTPYEIHNDTQWYTMICIIYIYMIMINYESWHDIS
jgi:hypothetical protein